jgi:hypothetical protein
MPGDNADEREEAYDNHDWDAADGWPIAEWCDAS